ncbi:MAG: FtsK/SpoIIIE domain-containing protein [Chloroflexota bacterium]|nr:FtsK/SpoIIIE domain-containing protein [Chloroflexota bacterium]
MTNLTQIQNQIQGHEMPAPTEREARHYWKMILSTLHQRGELQKRPRQGGYVVPQLTVTLLLPQRIIYILNMQKLGGISRETWAADLDLWRQWRAALDGRVVFVTDSAGLAITVGRDPALGERLRALPEQEAAAKDLPTKILLTQDDIPTTPYTVRLGYTAAQQPLDLNLAEAHRALLVGGTSGYGKTTFLRSAVLQAVCSNSQEALQLAVIDLKEVDFTGTFARLPHYFRPVAYHLEAAEMLIEQLAAEQLRRQALLHHAEVSNWQQYNAQTDKPLPLLLLVVDEVADLVTSPAMATLVQLARKGRAAGISIIAATQHPTTRVLDTQVKANLPTAIAFRTKSGSDSRVILDHNGAEELSVPGRALIFQNGWQTVQTLYVDREQVTQLLTAHVQAPRPTLNADETTLVQYALNELNGDFVIGKLYAALKGEVSKRRITDYGKKWEQRGWLTAPRHDGQGHRIGRRLTNELVNLLP